MAAVLKASVALTVLIALLTIVLAVTGLHKNPIVGGLGGIAVAILFNIGCVLWCLKQTASENGYGKQFLNGLFIGVIAGALIFIVSWVMLTVVFPHYLAEVQQANIELLRSAGMPDEQLQARVASIEAATPVSQSLAGLVGTLVTSVIAGAIIAIFRRKK
jgi:hypothetical protein